MITLDEPAAEYHANDAIGSGDIRGFLRSPQLYLDQRAGLSPRETSSMLFGTASHLAMLQPELFVRDCVHKPDGMSFATKEGKAWQAEHADRIIVTHKDWCNLERMHERMPSEVRSILTKCDREVTVRRELNGLQVQCRFDLWTKDRTKGYDLKSIANMEALDKSIWKLRYDVQERWYTLLGQSELETKKRPAFAFIFVETNPPHRWRIVELDLDYKMRADADIDRAFIGIQERMKSGDWSDPEDLHEMVGPPAWAIDDEDETEDGE